jgi:hypothetical protein
MSDIMEQDCLNAEVVDLARRLDQEASGERNGAVIHALISVLAITLRNGYGEDREQVAAHLWKLLQKMLRAEPPSIQ